MKTVFSPFEFIFYEKQHYFLFKEQLGVIRMEIKNDQWEGEWSRKNMLFFHFICVIMCNTVFSKDKRTKAEARENEIRKGVGGVPYLFPPQQMCRLSLGSFGR